MEILLWLAPPVVVTLVAMAWAGWMGRAGQNRVDHDEALRRMGEVLEQEPTVTHRVEPAQRERSTGVAVRRPADDQTDNQTDSPTRDPGQEVAERKAS